jgi:glycosyltransferase involved in cell wall biosynthesis
MRSVHFVLPNDIDDPASPSGGNAYDRRVSQGLAALGWSVREHAVWGGWPRPSPGERADLGEVLSGVPDDAVVLIDGLIASAVPQVLAPQTQRLRLVVLVHMPLDDEAERDALSAARVIVTTSKWTCERLAERYGLARIHVATPGVDPAAVAPGSGTGTRLLCVAAVTPNKGHDLLVDALATVADVDWTCVCVGSLDRDPGFVRRIRQALETCGLADRVELVGPRTGPDLDAAYAEADLLVLASRGETYGMVVTEALARGIPVLATAVTGLPDAMGHATDGSRPGLLVEPGDAAALARALRSWLGGTELRQRLRRSALDRRAGLSGWAVTAELVSTALERA